VGKFSDGVTVHGLTNAMRKKHQTLFWGTRLNKDQVNMIFSGAVRNELSILFIWLAETDTFAQNTASLA